MYRLIVESLLGLRLEGRDPAHRALPARGLGWIQIHYRYRETLYQIVVTQGFEGERAPRVTVDGIQQAGLAIPLIDDRQEHAVEVRLSRERRG